LVGVWIGDFIELNYFSAFIQNLTNVKIELERTACLGTCPIFIIILYGNGTIIYEEKQFVKTEGIQTYRISKNKTDE